MVKRLIAGLLTLALALGCLVVQPKGASAAISETEYLQAAQMLNKYGLVQGDNRGYRVYAEITRGELAKLVAYSLGQQAEAARRQGRGTFPDTVGHWADGVVAVTRTMGLMNGYPEGDFKPDNPVTYAEVITVLSRMAGLEPSSEPWPRSYLQPALDAGIIPAEMGVGSKLGASAARGDVFVMLWKTLTEVKNYDGQTLLRRYLDQTAPTLTVDPQPQETAELQLTVTGAAGDAAKVLVNGTPAQLGFGAFRATVDLRLGPNTIRVQAIDDAGNVRQELVQVTRTQSPPGNLTMTGPARVGAGQSATYTITLKDQNGQAVTDLSKVQVTVTPADLGTLDPATGTFKAGPKPGVGTVMLQAGSASFTLPITVEAGPLARLAVVPGEVGLDARASTVFGVKGYDAFDNEVPVGAATWSATDGTISGSGVYTAPDTVGTYTVTATASGKTATATVQPPNYQVAAIRLTQPTAAMKANGLTETTLTATLLDAKNQKVTDYTGSLTVVSSQPGTAAPVLTSVPVVGGEAQIRVRAGTVPGTATITASTNLGKSGSAVFTVNPQRLQSVRLTGVPTPSVNTTAAGYVEAVALDDDGNPMRSALPQALLLHLKLSQGSSGSTGSASASSGPAAWFVSNGKAEMDVALGPVDSAAGDVRTRTYVQYNAGTGTFLIEGTPGPASMAWVQVLPGALRADQVGMPAGVRIEPAPDGEAGKAQSIYVNVVDENGYRVTLDEFLTNVVVMLRDQNGVQWSATKSAKDSKGRLEFSVTQAVSGTYTYTAILQPGNATATQQVRVNPASVARVNFTITPDTLQADNAARATLRAEVLDGQGNRVTAPAYQVTFRRLTNNGAIQAFADQTVSTVNGVAQLTVTASTVAAYEDFQVSVANPASPGTPWTATARLTTRGVPDHLAISYGDNNGNGVPGEVADATGRAGTPLTIHVDVLDRFGQLATYDTGRSVTMTYKNLKTGQEAALPAGATQSGRATFYLNQTDAATYALKAESGTLTRAVTLGYGGTVGDAVLQPGNSLKVKVVADVSTLNYGGTDYAWVTAQLTDANGNAVANETGQPLMVTLSIPADGFAYGFFRVDDSGDRTAMRSVVIAPGASSSNAVKFFSGTSTGKRQVMGTLPDGTSGSATITSTSIGSAHHLVISEIAPASVASLTENGATSGQLVTVTVLDSTGRRVTNYSGTITLTAKNADTKIVAVYNPVTGSAVSLSPAGPYVAALPQVADRGQVTFVTRSETAGIKLYEASIAGKPAIVPATASGRFDGAIASDRLALSVDRPRIGGGGDRTTVTVKAVAADGSLVTSSTAAVTLTASDTAVGLWVVNGVATPGPVTVNLVNGMYTAYFQSVAEYGFGEVPELVTANSGALSGSTSFVVDGTRPVLNRVTITSGPVDTGLGTANTGDRITFTFSEPIDPQGLVPGLQAGGTLNGNLGTVQFRTDGTIVFAGGTNLGTISAPAIGANATFTVASATMDPSGTTLTITLGNPTLGGNPTVTMPGAVTVTLGTVLKDLAGNGVSTPFTGVTVSGGF